MVKKNKKHSVFYTFPLITSGSIKEIEFSLIQFDILKHIKNKSKIKPMASLLNCSPANIRHHLKKLEKDNLVLYSGNNLSCGVWRITKSGLQVLQGGNRRKVAIKKEVAKKGCIDKKRLRNNKLTKLQSEIYSLIVEEGLTHGNIALKLSTSRQNITKHYQKALNKLHIIGGNKKEVALRMSRQPLSPSGPSRFRGHNYRWTIKYIEKLKGFKTGNSKIGNSKIFIWEDKIQIVSKDDFFGDTEEKAFFKGLDYFNSIWGELEKLYKVKLDGEGILNKNLYQCDIANIRNEIATVLIGEDNKFYVRDKKGVAWATFDNSFKLFEFETIRAKSVLPDQIAVQKHLNDWREHRNSLTNSELSTHIINLSNLVSGNIIYQNNNNDQIKNILFMIDELTREMQKIKDNEGFSSLI